MHSCTYARYYGNLQPKHSEWEELAHCAEVRGAEILAGHKSRRVPTGQPINCCRVEGHTFITSSAWRNDGQAAAGGVGLMVSHWPGQKIHNSKEELHGPLPRLSKRTAAGRMKLGG